MSMHVHVCARACTHVCMHSNLRPPLRPTGPVGTARPQRDIVMDSSPTAPTASPGPVRATALAWHPDLTGLRDPQPQGCWGAVNARPCL